MGFSGGFNNKTTGPAPGAGRDAVLNSTQWAQEAGQAGPGILIQNADKANTTTQQAGLLGTSALSGNAAATQQLMNPYQQQVVDATNAAYNKSGVQAVNSVDSDATRSGAFGGSRNAVAAGVAASNNELNRNQAVSGLLYSGYNTAMQQATTLANQGQTATAANTNLGMVGVNPGGSNALWASTVLGNQLSKLPSSAWTEQTNSGNATAGMSVGSMFGFGG